MFKLSGVELCRFLSVVQLSDFLCSRRKFHFPERTLILTEPSKRHHVPDKPHQPARRQELPAEVMKEIDEIHEASYGLMLLLAASEVSKSF